MKISIEPLYTKYNVPALIAETSIMDNWLVDNIGEMGNGWHWEDSETSFIIDSDEDAIAFRLRFRL